LTVDIALVLLILAVAIVLFATEKLRVDLVSMLVLLALLLTGLLTPEEAFSGFSNPAVITVWAIYIVSASLMHTGIADFIGQYVGRVAGTGEARLILVLMVTVAMMSAFMNNIGATAVLLPVSISLGRKANIPVSKLLMPLAFGSLLGGVTTLIGTPPNLLASDALVEAGLPPFSLFDFAPMGLIIVTVSIAYMVLIGRRFLPTIQETTHPEMDEYTTEYHLQDFITELRVKEDSPLVGKTFVESQLGERYDLTVIGLRREGHVRLGRMPNTHIHAGDMLLVRGEQMEALTAQEQMGMGLVANRGVVHDEDLESPEVIMTEVVVSQKAHFIGHTLKEIDFRNRFNVTVLAIWREEAPIMDWLADVPLHLGDTLLVQGRREHVAALRQDAAFLVLQEAPVAVGRRLDKAWLNLAIFVSMISMVALGWLHISVAAVMGAMLSILTGCLSMDEAYEAIEWKSVFLIAGMLPLGIAMEKTGTAQFLADGMIDLVGGLGPRGVLLGLFVLTTALTAFMSNAAAAVLVAPIAIQTAFSLGVAPYAFVMGVAISASNSFVTPIGHQSCVLVYGPGGYRFFDFTRVGLPMTVLIWLLMVLFLPTFFPF
jgi:di/tricarboxylate transporter